jgi:tRNA threonylcarbamoyladenosine biosynthesis protein TsaE
MSISRSVAETERLAQAYLASLVAERDGAAVLGLSGDLGSGKTTFVQCLARSLGVTQAITSPTFVIEKVYKLSGQKFEKLVHIDAYRLENSAELLQLGFAELLRDKNNLIVIEWVERVQDILASFRKIEFKFIDEETREINPA